jgi:hypothetical protein
VDGVSWGGLEGLVGGNALKVCVGGGLKICGGELKSWRIIQAVQKL